MGIRGPGAVAAVKIGVERPDPPETLLRDDEKALWVKIVDDLPPDWFRPHTHVLLEQYCRLTVNLWWIAKRKEEVSNDEDEIKRLMRLEGGLSHTIMLLATKMRMTQRGTFDRYSSKNRGVIGIASAKKKTFAD